MLWAQETAGLELEVQPGMERLVLAPGATQAQCVLAVGWWMSWCLCTAVHCAQGSKPAVPCNRLPSLYTRWLNFPTEKWL